eukprot:3558254-Pleurochrysis_carterae.AAC.2
MPPLSMSRAPAAPSSAYETVTTSPALVSTCSKISAAAAAKMARIVNVLPEPVCPYISTVAGRDCAASCTRGDAAA